MSELTHVTDLTVPKGTGPAQPDRPLILDQMPGKDRINSPSSSPVSNPAASAEKAATAQAGAPKQLEGDFLNITPLDFGSTNKGTAAPVEATAAQSTVNPAVRPPVTDTQPPANSAEQPPATDAQPPAKPAEQPSASDAQTPTKPAEQPPASDTQTPAKQAEQPPASDTQTPAKQAEQPPASDTQTPVKPADPPPAQPDPFKVNDDKLVPAAEHLLGQNLTQAPRGLGFPAIPKAKGCAASVSNVLIKDGQIDPKDFEFNVDDLATMLEKKGAIVVDAAHLQKGDIIVGTEEKDHSGGRHVGIVDVDAKGQLIALNNNDGTFGTSGLESRFFAKYANVYGLRLPQS